MEPLTVGQLMGRHGVRRAGGTIDWRWPPQRSHSTASLTSCARHERGIDMPVDELTTEADVAGTTAAEATVATEPALLDEELLVEEVSIDGMCGVY
jgi:mycofactocin precursor